MWAQTTLGSIRLSILEKPGSNSEKLTNPLAFSHENKLAVKLLFSLKIELVLPEISFISPDISLIIVLLRIKHESHMKIQISLPVHENTPLLLIDDRHIRAF